MLLKYPEEVQLSLSRLSIPPNYPSTDVFTKFQSPGKGWGLKAICYLPRGSPILSDWAYFSIANNANLSRVQENDESFKELSCPAPVSAEKRFDANNFQMGKSQRGIFLRASRFNHSCRPNAYFAALQDDSPSTPFLIFRPIPRFSSTIFLRIVSSPWHSGDKRCARNMDSPALVSHVSRTQRLGL